MAYPLFSIKIAFLFPEIDLVDRYWHSFPSNIGNEPFVCRADKDSRCDRYRCLPFRRFETYYLRQESSFRHKESVLAVPFDLLIPNCPRAEWFALWSFARINDATWALSRRRDVLDFRRFEARWKSAHRFCHQKSSRLAHVKQWCLNLIDI